MQHGGPSATEATALALLALASPSTGEAPADERAVHWLRTHQRDDGSWPFSALVAEGSWATAVAVLALLRAAGSTDDSVRGGIWLLGQRGRGLGLLASVRRRLFPRDQVVELDDRLRGWAWTSDAFSWIEPTSHAVLALRALRRTLPDERLGGRVAEAEAMIRDRACEGGGWNYGNSRVLDEVLWPYPDTTALALMALHDGPHDGAVRDGLRALRRMLRDNDSGLAVALGILAFRLYGEEVEPLRARLREQIAATELLGETRPLALAALALDERRHPFDVRSA